MEHAQRRKTRWSRSEKALLIAGGGMALLALAGALWWQMAARDPSVQIPTPQMPAVNARDFYVRAGSSTVGGVGGAVSSRSTMSWKDREDLIRANGPALHTLRQGFAHPYREPPIRSFRNVAFGQMAPLREAARLLSLDGQVKEHRGDTAGAMNSYLDAVQMGADIPRGGILINDLVGIACQAIGRRPAWDLASRLSARDAKAAARRMETLRARQVAWADALQQEKWSGQAGLLETFRDPQALAQMQGGNVVGNNPPGPQDALRSALTPLLFLVYPKQRIFDNYTRFMDAQIANAGQSYAAKPKDPPVPNDPLNRVMMPVFQEARVSHVRNEAQNALLLTTLALRAYRAEHGSYPTTLDKLVPAYIAKLPGDPFALSGPPLYRQIGDKYTLYSLGPDGKDDNGTAINNPNRGGSRRTMVERTSTGDMVAGVNTP